MTMLVTNKNAYQSLNINIKGITDNSQPTLRIFNDNDLVTFKDYYVLSKDYDLAILDQSIWGFCVLKAEGQIQITSNSKNIVLKKSSNKNCHFSTKIMEYNEKLSKNTVYFACAVISIIIGVLFYSYLNLFISGAYYLRKNGYKLNQGDEAFSLNLFLSAGILIAWGVMNFPIVIDDDFFNIYYGVKHYHLTDWFGYVNDLFFLGSTRLYDNIAVFLLLSLSTAYLLQVHLLIFIRNNLKSPGWLFFYSLVLMLPSIGGFLGFVTRDLLVLYGNLFLAFYLINRSNISRDNEKVSYYDFLAILVAVIVSDLRREELIVSLLFLVGIIIFSKLNLKRASILVFTFIFIKLISVYMSLQFNQYSVVNRKILVTLSHYVGTLVTVDYYSEDSELDKKILGDYFNLDVIHKHHTDHGAGPTHNGGIKEQLPKDGLGRLYKLLFKMIWDNKWLTLKGRLKMLYYNLGPSYKTIYYPLAFVVDENNTRSLHQMNQLNLNSMRETKVDLYKHVGKQISYYSRDGIWRNIVYGGSFSAILLLVIVLLYKKFGVISMACLLIFSRVPVYLVLSPASQFKYIADIYVMGILMVPFVVVTLKKLYRKS